MLLTSVCRRENTQKKRIFSHKEGTVLIEIISLGCSLIGLEVYMKEWPTVSKATGTLLLQNGNRRAGECENPSLQKFASVKTPAKPVNFALFAFQSLQNYYDL